MTIRLALVIYFVLWLIWLVAWYFRRYHGEGRRETGAREGSPTTGRTLLYLVIWASIIIAAATAWRVLHPGME